MSPEQKAPFPIQFRETLHAYITQYQELDESSDPVVFEVHPLDPSILSRQDDQPQTLSNLEERAKLAVYIEKYQPVCVARFHSNSDRDLVSPDAEQDLDDLLGTLNDNVFDSLPSTPSATENLNAFMNKIDEMWEEIESLADNHDYVSYLQLTNTLHNSENAKKRNRALFHINRLNKLMQLVKDSRTKHPQEGHGEYKSYIYIPRKNKIQ